MWVSPFIPVMFILCMKAKLTRQVSWGHFIFPAEVSSYRLIGFLCTILWRKSLMPTLVIYCYVINYPRT